MRAFIAVDVPEEIKKKLMNVSERLRGRLKLVKRDNLHITLLFLGEINNIEYVKKSLDEIKTGPFEILCKGLGVFPNKRYIRVVWAGADAEELVELSNILSKRLKNCGLNTKPEDIPHITLARVKYLSDEEKKHLNALIDEKRDESFGKWIADRIALKKSTLTPNGPIYETVFEVELC